MYFNTFIFKVLVEIILSRVEIGAYFVVFNNFKKYMYLYPNLFYKFFKVILV